jgi:DNA polymerase III epsilon subunit-like protein
MKYLIFDTETTGFPKSGVDWDSPTQARVCQLAWVKTDERFREISCFKALICSDGKWMITEGAYQTHGISQHDCDKYGCGMRLVLPLFMSAIEHSDLVAAHNIMFDIRMMDIECDAFKESKITWEGNKFFCTMQAMTPICKLENKNGRAGFKWPKLREAYFHCFGEELKDAHDALADVRATTRILKWLNENRQLPAV